MGVLIHPTAIIDSKAELGDGCSIGPYCIIGPKVTLGKNVWLQSHVRIERNTTIDDDCRVYHCASVGNDPQDLKYNGEDSILTIGARTVIREFAALHRGTSATGKSTIGSDCLFMNYTHVPHDCVVGNHVIMSNSAQIAGHCVIGDWAIIGGLSGIHQFSRIGAHCMVGFGSRVVMDVPPFVLAAGEPLKPAGVNKIGLLRRGFTEEIIDKIKRAYKILYHGNFTLAKAVEQIRQEIPGSPEIEQIITFVESSKRGIIR